MHDVALQVKNTLNGGLAGSYNVVSKWRAPFGELATSGSTRGTHRVVHTTNVTDICPPVVPSDEPSQ